MTTSDKLKEVNVDLIHQFDPHTRIRLFNERSVLTSTISQLESTMIKKKREEIMRDLVDEEEIEKNEAKRIREILADDDREYYKQRLDREKDVAFLTKTEADRLIAKGTDSKLKVPDGKASAAPPKKSALKPNSNGIKPSSDSKKSVTVSQPGEEKKKPTAARKSIAGKKK